MQVNGTLGTGGASLGATSVAGQSLGKAEFLKLLTAQLAHQDPLSPLENHEFVAQLSQFSSVEQLMNANENLSTLQLLASSQSNTEVAGLIGKEVEARGDTLRHTQGPNQVRFDLSGAAKDVKITIKDAQGKIVAQLEASDRPAGAGTIAWDGKDSGGNMAATGNYKVEVSATGADGKEVTASLKFSGKVTGVRFEGGVPLLEIGDTTIQVADVTAVRQPAAATP
jgi:flagellar basal-body rod modification protein FlgD